MGGKLSQKNGRRMAGGKPIPKSQFALPNANGGKGGYPLDTVKRARNALSRIAQHGTPEQKAKVRRAVQRRYSGQVNVGGVQSHSNIDFADGDAFACPHCGYSGSADDFRNDGDYDDDSARKDGPGITPDALRTPGGNTGFVRNGAPLTVRGSSKTLANSGGRAIGLARRMPVQRITDIVISRRPDGTAVVRHRQGGNEVGLMKRNDNGAWQPVVDGKSLTEHSQQRAALLEMFGTYNRQAVAQPIMAPPQQTPLMQQFGVPAIRLATSDDDADDTDSASSDTSSGGNGLNPRGQGIYKKLVAKGVKPAVAMAMAKRAQNKAAGSFGGK